MFVGKEAHSFDVKNPNKRICVREFHFKDGDLATTLGRGKKKVMLGRVPLIFREQPITESYKTTTKELTCFIFWIRSGVTWSFIVVIIRKRTIRTLCRTSVRSWNIDRRNQATPNKKWTSSEKEKFELCLKKITT